MKPQESAKILAESGIFEWAWLTRCSHEGDYCPVDDPCEKCQWNQKIELELTANQAANILAECGLQVVWDEMAFPPSSEDTFDHDPCYCVISDYPQEVDFDFDLHDEQYLVGIPKGQITEALNAAVAWVCQQPQYAEALRRGIEKARKA